MSTESITQLIQNKARLYGPKPALSLHGGDRQEQYSYAELDDVAGRLATGLLNLGLEPGDRVALLSEARPRWGVAFFAAIRAGAVIVPLDTRASEADLIEILDDAKPRYLLVSRQSEALAEALVDGREDLLVFSVEAETEAMLHNLMHSLEPQNIDLANYLSITGQDPEEFLADTRERAERSLRHLNRSASAAVTRRLNPQERSYSGLR